MKTSLNRNLLIGFSFSLIILILSSTASFISIKNLLTSAEKVTQSSKVTAGIDNILSTMKDAETGQRGFLLTNDELFLQPYNEAVKIIRPAIRNVEYLLKDDSLRIKFISQLDGMILARLEIMDQTIRQKRANEPISLLALRDGKIFMDNIRAMVKKMNTDEIQVLAKRTAVMNQFARYTPILIVVAAILSLLITIIFYLKVKADIADKIKLQEQLLIKDTEVTNRIKVIENIADQISAGDFSIRIHDEEKDNLGNLAISLNKMADSLAFSFKNLSDKEWLQTGLTQLNDALMGDDTIATLTKKTLGFIVPRTGCSTGAFYLLTNEQSLVLQDGYGLNTDVTKQQIEMGEGMIGQVALNKIPLLISDTTNSAVHISFASVQLKPVNIYILPVLFQHQIKAVIELSSLQPFTQNDLLFLNIASDTIGITINTVQNRQRVQQLLNETQSQSEELRTQHTELEQMNAELETQAQQLQSSEEELKVQQEELMETNTMLEERSVLLEDRNIIVQQKNKEIQQRVEELALSTRYKSEFLANMSHELRTPLNSILLLSRLMTENQSNNLSPDQVKYAQVIQNSGNGLLQLIDEILDLSKIESGKMTIEILPVTLLELSTELHSIFDPVAAEKNIGWEIKMGIDGSKSIETDKLRLNQILKNLLSNAFKFTQKGHVHLVINSKNGEPDNIAFTVVDTGIGIEVEKQQLIFEAFQQEDGSTRRKYGGTGLGLSISRELAKILGGQITVTSEPGKGSAFTLQLLVKKNNDYSTGISVFEQPVVTQKNITATSTYKTADPYNTEIIPDEIPDDRNHLVKEDKIILVIEDDIEFAKALLDYTQKKGYKVIVAVRGDRGVELAIQYHPVAILLDIQLPVKNGWQVIDELKKNRATKNIPVHIMSSFQVKKESLVKGASNFINKPIAFEQLNSIFDKLDYVMGKNDKKVLIVEDNIKHAKALAYWLGTYGVNVATCQSISEAAELLLKAESNCVILDLGVTAAANYMELAIIKNNKHLEKIPIIIFTGKNISQQDEGSMKKYADTIVLKTAHAYQRILDEVSLFLHLVEEQQSTKTGAGIYPALHLENVLKNNIVLMADDDVRNIFALTKALEQYQMKIVPAMDGKEALQLLTEVPGVDIVLMDMMMPEIDGYQTIAAIRNNPVFKHLPVIAVTAKAMTGDREKCITAGASDYISKPVDVDQLVSLLRIWLYEKN